MKPGRLVLNVTTIGPLCLTLAVSNLHAQTAQQPPPASTTTQAIPTPTPQPQTPPPPDNLERIRAGLQRPSFLKMEPEHFRIYVDILAKAPTFQDLTKGYDWINGPTGDSKNAMSHQEFLGMVTPKDMVGSGGVQPGEILTMAAVNYVGQLLIKKGVKAVTEGRANKKITAIQAQIDRELAALKGGK